MTHVRLHTFTLTASLTAALVAAPAAAQPPAPAPVASPAQPPAPAPVASPAQPPAPEPTSWHRKHAPVARSWELGVYGGAFVPSSAHEFYDDLAGPPHQALARAGLDVGARVGYYPLRFLGLELEGAVIPMKVADGTRATLYTLRPVLVGQLPYRLAPFVRAGFGMVGISSTALGKDMDPSLNLGGGLKFHVNDLILLRLDVVDNIATARGVGRDRSNNLEVLLGVSLRPGKVKAKAAPGQLRDSDRDGLYDPGQTGVRPLDEDVCPLQPGPASNRGCPLIDSDLDGLYDPNQPAVPLADVDACPLQPGPRDSRGCPLKDSDGDTLYDPGQPVAAADTDECPMDPGPRPLRGCPDRDDDKIPDLRDSCPLEPETVNQYRDADGCADSLPTAVQNIRGVLEGIFFDTDKDTIKPRSRVVLDRAVRVLRDHPETRWDIEGHTDSDGTHEHNRDLSHRRAEAVRNYLVANGIDERRLVPRGFGPDVPRDTNATRAGKAKNRRIEFKLID